MDSKDFLSLHELALELATGGKRDSAAATPGASDALAAKARALLGKDSGENGLTCLQAMKAHCSGACTAAPGGAVDILKQLASRS
jgi:hypothetical protein